MCVRVVCICVQKQKMSEDHPSKLTDSLTKATLDEYGEQGMCF